MKVCSQCGESTVTNTDSRAHVCSACQHKRRRDYHRLVNAGIRLCPRCERVELTSGQGVCDACHVIGSSSPEVKKQCKECGEPKVTNPDPRARVCLDCRRAKMLKRKRAASSAAPPGVCWRCRKGGVPLGKRVCEDCRVRGVRVHRECKRCGGPFSTTSAATSCNRCLHQSRKHPCADCGVPVDGRAVRCRQCVGVTLRAQGAVTT